MRFFGVNFILQKFCSCKKNDKYEVWCVAAGAGGPRNLWLTEPVQPRNLEHCIIVFDWNPASLAKLAKGVMTKLLLGTYCDSWFPWQSTLMSSYCVVVLTGLSCPVSHLSCGERGWARPVLVRLPNPLDLKNGLVETTPKKGANFESQLIGGWLSEWGGDPV